MCLVENRYKKERNIMKKFLAVMLVLVLALGAFVGCGGDQDTEGNADGKVWVVATDTVFKPFE